jgi:hypothetical protein
MKLRNLTQKLKSRLRLEVGGGQATEVFAGRAVAAGHVTLVPIWKSHARIATGSLNEPKALGGSTGVDFIGAWIEQPRLPPRWLPMLEAPPGTDTDTDWQEWLISQPDLMSEIVGALAQQGRD